MGLLKTIFVAALASLPLALGQASISTQQICLTELGPKSVSPLPSSTIITSYTNILTAVQTSTPQVTSYPPTFTVTTTVISSVTTTTSQTTGTFSSTSTVVISSTQTNTVTSTITSSTDTTITTTDTTTVPTSAGFQFPGTSIVVNKRAVWHEYRDKIKSTKPKPGNDSNAETTRQKVIPPGQKTTKDTPQRYPTSVICQQTINTYMTTTVVTTAATATQIASTPTITATQVTTFTSTFLSTDASTTLTFTKTIQTTDTVVITFTQTVSVTNSVTVTGPGPTVYAACAAANLIDSGDGHSINFIRYLAAASESLVSASTPYDCCVACQDHPLCGGTDFAFGTCELIFVSTCDAMVAVAGYKADGSVGAPAPGSTNRFVLSNGNCGNVVYLGLDGV